MLTGLMFGLCDLVDGHHRAALGAVAALARCSVERDVHPPSRYLPLSDPFNIRKLSGNTQCDKRRRPLRFSRLYSLATRQQFQAGQVTLDAIRAQRSLIVDAMSLIIETSRSVR